MNYGEQRYKENIKELTPEQKARQTLILEAMREQTAYERKKRRDMVANFKTGLDILSKGAIFLIGAILLSTLFSCDKEDTIICDAVVGKSVFHNGVDREDTVNTYFFTLDTGKKVIVDLETYNSIQSIKGDKLYCR